MGRWLVNGEAAGVVDIEDRGFAYGDGLFETIAWRQATPRLLDRHLARLTAGCRRLALPVPDAGMIRTQLASLGAGTRNGTAKLIVTRGPGPRGYRPPSLPAPTLAIGFFPAAPGEPRPGAVAVTCTVPASENAVLAGIKTLGRLDNVMAQAQVMAVGADEGIMFGGDGRLVGGTSSNLFLVRAGQLFTPAIGSAGVAGIMRDLVLEIAAGLGIPSVVGRLGTPDLAGAEEMFVTSSLVGIRPVHRLDGRVVGTGPLTARLMQALAEAGVREPGP